MPLEKDVLDACGQNHLRKYINDLSPKARTKYIEELDYLDVDFVNSAFQNALKIIEDKQFVDGQLMCPNPSICGHADFLRVHQNTEFHEFVERGLLALSERKVAVLLLSGGQGTRLNTNNPKGMYSIGLPSGRSLFQIQAERLLTLCRQVSKKFGQEIYIPWYIMTSDKTQLLIEKYFSENNFFGYSKNHVIFFEQFNIPALSLQGKILMKDKGSLCWSPEGNGGLYRVLMKKGILKNMRERGVEYVHIYGVDNVLIQMADPAFLGYCLAKDADCAIKAVEKVEPTEPIGVVGVVDGKFQVVEYSEISPSTAALTMPRPPIQCGEEVDAGVDRSKPRLLYSLGNICNHFMTREFLEYVCDAEQESKLPYHVARKTVPHLDVSTGELVTSAQPNAIKLEKFIFDVFPFSRRFFIWEVDRAKEFSPLKNGSGSNKDSPETCLRAILTLHASWAMTAGALFGSQDNVTADVIEISPLVSLNGENLECLKGRVITGINVLELQRNEDGDDVPTLIQIKAPV